MKICASLGAPADLSAPELAGADLVEIRLDRFGSVPAADAAAGKPMVVTFRGRADLSVLPDGFSGFADIGDMDAEGERLPAGLTVIRSHHDFDKTPDEAAIRRLLEEMASNELKPGKPADVLKAAFMVRDLSDLRAIGRAVMRPPSSGRPASAPPHVVLGMGPLGVVTRIRRKLLGNLFSFAYISEPTAPGQLSVSEMKRLGDDCLITGLLGHPLDHSVSPKMHDAAFRETGLCGKYLLFDTPSLEGLPDVMRLYDIRGLNVTVPYKVQVIDYLDGLDDAARKIGAVNTIINENGKLIGSNTDFEGIRLAFEKAGVDLSAARVLVMGSGGAARACLYLLSQYDCAVTVAGRNEEAVRSVCAAFGAKPAVAGLSPEAFDIIINATPIGMGGRSSAYPIDVGSVRASQAVFDMVYNTMTPLVKAARAAGAAIVSGADMLAGQGARSFEYWTGRKISADVMRREIPETEGQR